MALRPEIWLADFLWVLDELEPGDEAAIHIARVLGIGRGDRSTFEAEPSSAPEPPPLEGNVPQSVRAEEPAWGAPPPAAPTPALLEPVGTAPWPGEVDWSDAPRLDPPTRATQATSRPFEPLLAPLTAYPVLGAMLATDGPGDEIDVPRLVEQLTRRRPVDEIPFLTRPSLFRGVHVLVDIATPMALFARDQSDVIGRLREFVGREDVHVERYQGSPARGCGAGSVGTWTAFEPPLPGTPVLVLGDLGMGTDPDDVEQDWLELAALLARRSSRLVALVPYEPDRWETLSPALRAAVQLVTWDRSTSVSDIDFRVRR